MGIQDEVTFSAAELKQVADISADAMTDVYRDRERELWGDFVRSRTMEARKAHFSALMSLITELDTRAALLLKGEAEKCTTIDCPTVPVFKVYWPGSEPKPMCQKCAERAKGIGHAMGLAIPVEALP